MNSSRVRFQCKQFVHRQKKNSFVCIYVGNYQHTFKHFSLIQMLKRFVFLICLIVRDNALKSNVYDLSEIGHRFQPANAIELLETLTGIRNVMHCGIRCHHSIRCRTFQYDSSINECRLFEGSINTGQLQSNFSSSIVGWIPIKRSMFTLYNATIDQCRQSRLLNSSTSSGLCECPINTFWNGSMCLNQIYEQQTCMNNNWCRTDLFYICNASKCIGKISKRKKSRFYLIIICFSID